MTSNSLEWREHACEDEPLSCVVVRSDQEAVVVNLNLVEVADPAVAG